MLIQVQINSMKNPRKQKNNYHQILTLALLTTLFLIANPQNAKPLSSSCLCDISQGCDGECCCDAECLSAIKQKWSSYGLCADDSLSIPVCQAVASQPLTQDLYSGLRTIYTVIKRLFCISRINFVDLSLSYRTMTSSADLGILEAQSASISAIDPRILSLENVTTVKNIPLKNSMGFCNVANNANDSTSNSLKFLQQIPSQTCKILIRNSSSILDKPILSIQNLVTASNPQIKIKDNTNGFYNSPNQTLTTTCSGSTCINVVRFVKLIFTVSGSTATLSGDSYAVVGSLEIGSDPFYTQVGYSYQFVGLANQTTSTSFRGYALGSTLQLLQSVTLTNGTIEYYRILNPISPSFSSSPISLQFGKDSFYSCPSASCNFFTSSTAIFNLIGRIASPINLGDYISIPFPATEFTSMQLLIFYVKVGAENNPQYSIVNVQVNQIAASNSLKTLFVEYQEVQNSAQLYVPSPPKLNVYLSDDWLYPFIVG